MSLLKLAYKLVIATMMLLLVVAIHELGHYLVGRMFNIKIKEFSVGVGPVKFLPKYVDRRNTVWRIGLLPVGGYVSFPNNQQDVYDDGENRIMFAIRRLTPRFIKNIFAAIGNFFETIQDKSDIKEAEIKGRYINMLRPQRKFLLAAAGPIANFVLSACLLIAVYTMDGYMSVAGVVKEASASHSQLLPGDVVTKVNNKVPVTMMQLYSFLKPKENKITISRGKDSVEVICDSLPELVGKPLKGARMNLAASSLKALNDVYTISISTLTRLVGFMVKRNMRAPELSGPLGIIKRTSDEIDRGIYALLYWTATLSISLGVVNLLIIPPFDGSIMLLSVLQMIFGIRRKWETLFGEIAWFVVLFFTFMTARSDFRNVLGRKSSSNRIVVKET